jgi:hypothetical protein
MTKSQPGREVKGHSQADVEKGRYGKAKNVLKSVE